MKRNVILTGDALQHLGTLPDQCVQTCITSPPYWNLRDYGVEGQLGLEKHPEEYIAKMVEVFREVKRVLRDDGTLWCNIGDSYNSAASNQNGRKDTKATIEGGSKYYTNGDIGVGRRKINNSGDLKPKDLVGIP